jgi:hypothetical protein
MLLDAGPPGGKYVQRMLDGWKAAGAKQIGYLS